MSRLVDLVGVVHVTRGEVDQEPVECPEVPVPDREGGHPVHEGRPHVLGPLLTLRKARSSLKLAS